MGTFVEHQASALAHADVEVVMQEWGARVDRSKELRFIFCGAFKKNGDQPHASVCNGTVQGCGT